MADEPTDGSTDADRGGPDRPVSVRELEVAMDYGQFSLHTSDDGTDPVAVLEQAQRDDGIAQSGGLLTCLSPEQYNFAMPLSVELWAVEPAADDDRWQVVYDASLDVDARGVEYESPTLDFVDLGVPPGRYRLRISGTGFRDSPVEESTGRWRLRFWPADDLVAPATLRRSVPVGGGPTGSGSAGGGLAGRGSGWSGYDPDGPGEGTYAAVELPPPPPGVVPGRRLRAVVREFAWSRRPDDPPGLERVELEVDVDGMPPGQRYGLVVSTPEALAELVRRGGTVDGRHMLFVPSVRRDAVESYLAGRVAEVEGGSPAELQEFLGRLARWEFEH